MKSNTATKSLTIRIPPRLYEEAVEVARQRSMSLNNLVKDGLSSIVRAEDERSRYDSYTQLAQDDEECDVEFAIHAQAEVMLRD